MEPIPVNSLGGGMVANAFHYSVVEPGTESYREYLVLRHEVFCQELGWIDRGLADPEGGGNVETDQFDIHSVHVLCRHAATGKPVGCCRLILPGTSGLNVFRRYLIDCPPEASSRVGEIGRLAIAKDLRGGRKGEDGCADMVWPSEPLGFALPGGLQTAASLVALGLYRELFRLAQIYGISHCYAAMRPTFARLLRRVGVPFSAAGPVNARVQPVRRPFIVAAKAVELDLLMGGGVRTAPRGVGKESFNPRLCVPRLRNELLDSFEFAA